MRTDPDRTRVASVDDGAFFIESNGADWEDAAHY